MKLRRPPPRQPYETVVAMIDVVFFLLVFFMLIGRMDATSPFEVLPPLGATGADLPAGGTLIAVGADGARALDGEAMAPDAVLQALAPRLAEDPELPLRIQAHQAAALGVVLPLLAQLEAMGARDVALIVTPPP